MLIDTSAWIEFFRARDPVASLVDRTLDNGQATLCGMVELEIRQGLRSGEKKILTLLRSLRRIPTEETDFAVAGDRLAELRRKGITIPGTDGLIAQLALRNNLPLLENDGHFKYIPDLRLVRS